MAIIKVNKINIFYEIIGQGEPLFLIAGFGANHLTWQTTADYLSRHYQVILVDNRGAGQSDVPDAPYSVEQMSNDIKCICDKLQIQQAHFIGSSLGGMIIQDFAYRYPKYIKSMIISNAAMKPEIAFFLFLEGQIEVLKFPVPPVALTKMALGFLFSSHYLLQPGYLEKTTRELVSDPYPITFIGYKNQLEALRSFDSSKWAHQIKVPCLVFGAEDDLICSEKAARALAEEIPGAKYYVFQKTGHLPFYERPELFFEVARDFMRRHK